MPAAIDLAPQAAVAAVQAARSKRDVLERRFEELEEIGEGPLLDGIVPYDGSLRHADGMIGKVRDFILKETEIGIRE